MSLIDQPPNRASLQNQSGLVEAAWQAFFTDVYKCLIALTQSGTTAQRPTKFLWAGRPYFDTTLGLPIWYNGTIWIKADGTAA